VINLTKSRIEIVTGKKPKFTILAWIAVHF